MPKPVVAIVGRPNVGKSSLFNLMAGTPKAVVEPAEGVTRDRNYADISWAERDFIAVDTGGFYYPEGRRGAAGGQEIFDEVKEQALFAVNEADLVIHLMDARDGLTPADLDIARMLRASGKEIICAVNKIDGPRSEPHLMDFYALGAARLLPVSAANGYMFEEFMEAVTSLLPAPGPPEAKGPFLPRIAVVGRPNVGKSTLVNSLLGKKRLIVSPVAGTTRDSIDTVCSYYGRKYVFIDTAGLRRKSKAYPVERFSMVRTLRSIEDCEVALVLLDATQGITAEDQKVAGLVLEHGKGAVFVLNKWDALQEPEVELKKLRGQFERKIWFFSHAPMLTASGLRKTRVTKIFRLLDQVAAERNKTVKPEELARFMKEMAPRLRLPLYKGRKVIVSGVRQIGSAPPVFAIMASEPAGLREAFSRHMESLLRERFSFAGVPIKIVKKKNR
jgi:GTP-binding protein